MKCLNCHAENRVGARFCAACGNRLPEAGPAAVRESEAIPETAVENATPLPVTQAQASAVRTTEPDVQSEEGAHPGEARGETLDETDKRDPSLAEGSVEETPEVADGEAEPAGAVEERPDEGLAPLPPGTLLADRYEIVELMSSGSDGNLYSALDLARCPVCGFDRNAPSDPYCADCGAALSSPPICEIQEQPQVAEPDAVARFNAGGRAYVVLAPETDGEAGASEPALPQRIRLRWGACTDRGRVREVNEDCLDVHVYTSQAGPTLGLFVVADGVGGQAAGEVASQLATQVIWEKVRETVWLPELRGEPVLPETMETRVEEAIQAANQAVYRQRTRQGNDMATTVTLALLRDTVAVIANVGDSRTYRWNAEGLQPLTVDHSLVQSLIEAGELEPEDVYTHPHRHIIHRSIGDRPRVEIDTFVHELAPGDRLILCSDGLWEMARDEGIEEILLREPDPQMACDALVERANLEGGSDNISVIIVEIEA